MRKPCILLSEHPHDVAGYFSEIKSNYPDRLREVEVIEEWLVKHFSSLPYPFLRCDGKEFVLEWSYGGSWSELVVSLDTMACKYVDSKYGLDDERRLTEKIRDERPEKEIYGNLRSEPSGFAENVYGRLSKLHKVASYDEAYI